MKIKNAYIYKAACAFDDKRQNEVPKGLMKSV